MASGTPNLLSALLTGDIWKDALVKAVNYLLTVEDWHYIGDDGEPAFNNNWVNRGNEPAAYYKDPFGRVHLKGNLEGSASNNTIAFTLPEGYRPDNKQEFATVVTTTDAHNTVTVQADGDVIIYGGSTNGAHLDGVSFRAAT